MNTDYMKEIAIQLIDIYDEEIIEKKASVFNINFFYENLEETEYYECLSNKKLLDYLRSKESVLAAIEFFNPNPREYSSLPDCVYSLLEIHTRDIIEDVRDSL